MTAEVIPSLAMEPGVRVINGFQAACLDHPEDGDRYIIGETLEEGVWMGEWHEYWINARIDAVFHNMVVHPETVVHEPLTPWWYAR